MITEKTIAMTRHTLVDKVMSLLFNMLSLGWEDSSGEGKGYPLQYSGLEGSLDSMVHGVPKSRTRLSNLHFHFH